MSIVTCAKKRGEEKRKGKGKGGKKRKKEKEREKKKKKKKKGDNTTLSKNGNNQKMNSIKSQLSHTATAEVVEVAATGS